MDNMYEQLMHLPLFQGVSRERISTLIEKYPFHFLKFHEGEQIIEPDEECTHLCFLVSGTVNVVTTSKVLRVSVSQTIAAPNVIGPDYLFGRHTQYPYAVTANDTCSILQISKADYIQILQSDKVFLFNILNYLSRNAQLHTYGLLEQPRGLVAERIAMLIVTLTSRKSANIELHYRQKDLCTLLGAQRSKLLSAMQELCDAGVITMGDDKILVADRDALVAMLKS